MKVAPYRPQLAAFAVALWGASEACFAARPLVTDDARIVDSHACQLESYIKSNQGSTEYWALPACNPTDNLELTLGGNWIRNDDGPNSSHLVFQGKTIFKPLEANGWGLGLAAGVVDTTAPDTMRRINDVYTYVPVTFSLRDDTVLVHVNAGVDRDRTLSETRFTWGLGNEIAINNRLAIVAETYGDNRENPFWQGGARIWIIPKHWQVDATIGGQFGAGHNGRWASIGIRLLSDRLF